MAAHFMNTGTLIFGKALARVSQVFRKRLASVSQVEASRLTCQTLAKHLPSTCHLLAKECATWVRRCLRPRRHTGESWKYRHTDAARRGRKGQGVWRNGVCKTLVHTRLFTTMQRYIFSGYTNNRWRFRSTLCGGSTILSGQDLRCFEKNSTFAPSINRI